MELKILFLCFAIALCLYAFITKANPDWNPENALNKKRVYFFAATVLFAVAVVVRAWQFGAVPGGVNQDGAMAAVDAKALADYGTDRFGMKLPVYFTAWGYGQMSVLLSYCMVPFIKLFGFSIVTVRLPMLLASIAGIYVLFRFTEKIFGKLPALFVLAFVAIDPWQIMQSRWALDCNIFPHFLLFSMYFLYLGLEKRPYLYVSMVFFALTMYAYGIAFYSVPLLLVLLCVYFIVKKRIRLWEVGACLLIYLFFAWPIFAVVLINTFKLNTLNTGLITIAYFPDSIRMNDLIIYSKDFATQLVLNIQALANVALLEKGDFSWNFIDNYGRMYFFTLPFVITGLWVLVRKYKASCAEQVSGAPEGNPAGLQKPRRLKPAAPPAATLQPEERQAFFAGRWMVAAWLIISVLSGLMVNGVNTNRTNIIFYPLCMLAGLGIWYVLFEAVKVRKIAILVAVIYTLSFGGFTAAYFGEHSQVLAKDFCSGFTDAVKYADGLDSDVLYVTAYSRAENAFTCSEIYTLFGADIDARYFQGVAPAFGRDGKQLLPYKDRYRYSNFAEFNFDQPIGAVFVFNAEEASLFDEQYYELKMFDGFGVAVKTAEEPVETEPDETAPDEPNDGSGGAVG